MLYAPDGESFEAVALDRQPRWVLDLHVGGDGALLVAHDGVPRGGDVVVSRFEGGSRTDDVLAGSDGLSDASFVAQGGRIALLEGGGAFLSSDDGRSFVRLARWDEGYGLYAARARLSADAALDVLMPELNTCGSSDRLEGLRWIRVREGGRPRRMPLPVPVEQMGYAAPLLAPDGALWFARERASGACELVSAVSAGTRIAATRPQGACWLHGRAGPRFAVGVIGADVLSLRSGGRAIRLGGLDADVVDVYPDSRGRALVLTRNGLARFSRHDLPRTLWPSAPPWGDGARSL